MVKKNLLLGNKGEIYGAETVYREIGYHIVGNEQHARSLKYFDQAVEKNPNNLRALIGRARARAKATHLKGALEDINHALSLYPDGIMPLSDKVSNTYLRCEFEEGLVENTRLLWKYKKPEMFHLGAMNCRTAIENSIGDSAGRPLRDHFFIIRKLAWKQNYAAQKPFEPVPKGKPKKKEQFKLVSMKQPLRITKEPVLAKSSKLKLKRSAVTVESLHSAKIESEPIPEYNQPFPFEPLQRYTTNIENYMAEKYLDKMYLDKIFLKEILNEPGIHTPNKKGSEKLKDIASDCFKSLAYKQKILRARRPFYFIKYQEAKVSGALEERQAMELQHHQFMTRREADVLLLKLTEAYNARKLKNLMHLVDELKRYCDGKPKKLLPDKARYMMIIYDTVCKALYGMFMLNKNQSNFKQNRKIYTILGLPLTRETSTDSIIAQFKQPLFVVKKQISEYQTRLKHAVVPDEVCWLYYELARLHLDFKQVDLARLYAKKCIQEASDANNDKWVVISAMLMCKSNIQQHNQADAKADLQKALKSAQRLQVQENIDFCKRCMEVLESIQFDDLFGMNEIRQRECKILKMISSTETKNEFAHLFRQMAAMPSARRMTVMPGIRPSLKQREDKRSRQMSIMPQMHDNESIAEIKTLSKECQNKGRSLMNLLELHL